MILALLRLHTACEATGELRNERDDVLQLKTLYSCRRCNKGNDFG
jgi:hypothetical protein